MNDLILKRCKYCDKQYTGTIESTCCSNTCQDKYSKYMNLREKSETKLSFIYITILLIFFLSSFIFPNSTIIMHYSFTLLLLFSALKIIFPFGEDIGLKKRGVKKTKILIRFLWSIFLIYGLLIYFRDVLTLLM